MVAQDAKKKKEGMATTKTKTTTGKKDYAKAEDAQDTVTKATKAEDAKGEFHEASEEDPKKP